MKSLVFILISLLPVAGFAQKKKLFPEFNYMTTDGQPFSHKNLEGKNSVVILFHLGCPPAMWLLKDIEEFNLAHNNEVQYIGILENTNEQIQQFNVTEKNDWSDIREYFKMPPSKIPLMGECEKENVKINKEGKRCRKLAKTLRTKSSPTLYFVNPEGQIVKVKKGYLSPESTEEVRKGYLDYN